MGHAPCMRWLAIVVVVSVGCGGSEGDTGADSVSASESGSSSGSESSSVTITDTDPGTESGSSSGSSSGTSVDTGTTGEPVACDQATDVNACMAASVGQVCLWLPTSTWVGGGDAACEPIDVGPTGLCALNAQDDGCAFPEPNCPDRGTTVWYREVGLEIGAIEILPIFEAQLCGAPDGFTECMYDAETSTWTPPECSCGCPMGE
jgi:hypothetical protein